MGTYEKVLRSLAYTNSKAEDLDAVEFAVSCMEKSNHYTSNDFTITVRGINI